MGRVFKIVAGLVLLVLLIAAGVSYSWTFTPIGRLEYGAAVIAKLGEWNDDPIELTPEARASANAMVAASMPPAVKVARIEDRTIDSGGVQIPIRIYWPEASGKLPVYLDIHGGGWWMGDGYAMESVTTRLANDAGVIIVSVDYRLAPEHPFPAPLDDCYAALVWLHFNAESLGGDPNRLGIGGGSAGGNLAEDLTGLPPALVITAHFDPLRDQGIAYAKRLQEAGVPTQLHAEPGGLHGFMGSPERRDRVAKIAATAVREALYR